MSSAKTILLLDMDGVLLHSSGYHRALQDTIAWIGERLGYQSAKISQDDIDVFESVGMTSEWDSSAICTAFMLLKAWEKHPNLKLPEPPKWQNRSAQDLLPLDFQAIARQIDHSPHPEASPLQRAEHLLLGNGYLITPEQLKILKNILRQARGVQGSLTHRLFQEFVLGSKVFEEIYHLPPILHVESYLGKYDHPTLNANALGKLNAWIDQPFHQAAIFTNRPSLPPDGSFGTPEAEIGARAAGVEKIPIIGLGSLSWLSSQRGLDNEAFIKPSPVHTLAALKAALGVPALDALYSAENIVDGVPAHDWYEFDGAYVYAFEDSARGMQSIVTAQKVLIQNGVKINLTLQGVADSLPKVKALREIGANIFPDLSSALEALPGSVFHK
jgi:hypothetical protein